MEQYARIISYLYRYKEGKKEENLGYAKIEKRGLQCRVQAQLRGRNIPDILQVYLFVQRESGIEGIFLGEALVRNGELLYKKAIQAENILDSGIKIDEIDGMLLYESREHFFGTTWTKEKIDLGHFMPEAVDQQDVQAAEVSKLEQEAVPMDSVSEEVHADETSVEETTEPEDSEGNTEVWKEYTEMEKTTEPEGSEENTEVWKECSEREEAAKPEEVTEPEEATEAEESSAEDDTAENETTQMEETKDNSLPAEEKEDCPLTEQMWQQSKRCETTYGERILAHYPPMHPFGMEEADACVRLELQDIGCLPMEMWHLSGNRFMLHGYYCYRHLLFMEHEGEFYLGTPGIYNEAMRREANIFGFSRFRAMGNQNVRQGAFGYWLLALKGETREKTR